MAWDQFKSSPGREVNPTPSTATLPELTETESTYEISGSKVSVTIDKETGALISYRLKDQELLHQSLVPHFWKHPNNNQWGNGYVKRLGVWKDMANERILKSITATSDDTAITIQASYDLPGVNANYHLNYNFEHGQRLRIHARYEPGQEKTPTMPRFGMQLAMPREFDQLTWYGRGPHETYWDRKTGGEIAIYRDTVENWNHSYIHPQDVGNRTDVRWMTLTNGSKVGLKVIGTNPLSVSA